MNKTLLKILTGVTSFAVTASIIAGSGVFEGNMADESVRSIITENGEQTTQTQQEFVAGEILVVFSEAAYRGDITKALSGEHQIDLPAKAAQVLAKYNSKSLRSVISNKKFRDKIRGKGKAKGKLGHAQSRLARLVKIQIDPNANLKRAIAELKQDTGVEYAEPNYLLKTDANDTYFGTTGSWGQSYEDLWGLTQTNTPNAWNTTEGAGVVVAVIDSGLDVNHVDIAANVWTNPAEIAGNGIDDDNNGYIDDVNGWDFLENDNVVNDDNGHGTHVSGTIAAVGNNSEGIIGVAPAAKIMPLKAMNAQGNGSSADLIAALTYAADMNADVINNSWGGSYLSYAFKDAVDYAHGKGSVVVASAGNSYQDAYYATPAQWDTVITVSAVQHPTSKASYSNYGGKIDIAAPGTGVLSLLAAGSAFESKSNILENKYLPLQGTSMAAPHVSGLAALILSQNPNYTPEQVRYVLKNTTQDIGLTGWDDVFGPGLMDASAAVAFNGSAPDLLAGIHTPSPYGEATENRISNNTFTITGNANGNDFYSYKVEYAPLSSHQPENFTQIASSTSAVTNGLLANWDSSNLSNGKYLIKLTVSSASGTISEAYTSVYKDSELVNGWPQLTHLTGYAANSFSSSASEDTFIEDLDGDGVPEIFGAIDHRIYLFDLQGNVLPGWPKTLGSTALFGDKISQAAVADLDNDGDKEIVIYRARQIYPSSSDEQAALLFAYHHDGSSVAGFPTAPWPTSDITSSSIIAYNENFAPSITDLDNDGELDIVVLGGSSNTGYQRVFMFAVDAQGNNKPGFPVQVDDDSNRPGLPQVITDIDNDGFKEIIVTTLNGEANIYNSFTIDIYGHDGLLEKSRQMANFADGKGRINLSYATNHLRVADLDRDGRKEIVFATKSLVSANDFQNDLYVLDADLNTLPGFPYTGGTSDLRFTPNIAQLDSDPELELIHFDFNRINAWNIDGSVVSGYPTTVSGNAIARPTTSAILKTGDHPNGISLGHASSYYSGQDLYGVAAVDLDGNYLPEWTKNTGSSNGKFLGITQPNAAGNIYFSLLSSGGMLYVWQKNIGTNQPSSWVAEAANLQRTSEWFDPSQIAPEPPNNCNEYTSSNTNHVNAGRAYTTGSWFKSYFAQGSGDSLGYSFSTTTLAETAPGYFIKGNCPAQQASNPQVTALIAQYNDINVTISGSAFDADNDLSKVEIEFDNSGNWLTANGTSSWSLQTTLAGGEHSVRARATDQGGRVSTIRGPQTFAVTEIPPNSAPSVGISSNTVNGSTLSLWGYADDVDENIEKVEVELDGNGNWLLANGSENWSFEISDLSTGDHSVVARVTDTEGLTGFSSTINFTVEVPTAPECSIATVSLTTDGLHQAPMNVSDANDDWETFEFRIDSGAWKVVRNDLIMYVADIETTPGELSPGNHTIDARVIDATDLIGTCGPVTFTVAQPEPPTISDVTFNIDYQDGYVPISGKVSDPNNDVVSIEYRVNDGNWILGDNPIDNSFYIPFHPEEFGTYEIYLRAIDHKENTSEIYGPITFEWKEDPGSAPSIDYVNIDVEFTTVTVSGTASDVDNDLVSVEVEFNNSGAWLGTAGTTNWSMIDSSLPAGNHTVRVRATDAKGNVTLQGPGEFTLMNPRPPEVTSVAVSVDGLQATISGNAKDLDGDLGYVEVEFNDSGNWIRANGKEQWNTVVTTLNAGTHTVKARAVDTKGLISNEFGPASFELVDGNACFESTLTAHVSAGRAYEQYFSYYATGTATYLGSTFLDANKVIALEEQTPGNWGNVTSCP